MKTNTLVIGGGPGGYSAAIRLGQLGIESILVEKHKLGGTCLNVGCIPSKALLGAAGRFYSLQQDFSTFGIEAKESTIHWNKTIEWKDQLVKKIVSGVEMLVKANKSKSIHASVISLKPNEAKLSNGETVQFENAIIATGSTIIELPNFPFDHKHVLNSTDLLSLQRIPKSMIILGGGIIGMELGTLYQAIGCQVTVVEMLPNILPMYEKKAANIVSKSFHDMGGTILTQTKAQKFAVKDQLVHLEIEHQASTKTIQAEKLAVAVGRKPNLEGLNLEKINVQVTHNRVVVNEQMQTTVPNIYAIGDLTAGPMLAHKASMEGVLCAEAIKGHKVSRKDVHVIPDVVYTKPEIAQAGLNLDQAKEQNLAVKVGNFPLSALGMAATALESKGYVQYIADESSHRVLGVVIVASKASDLIGEAALAIEMGATLEDVALTVHAHPSYSEAQMEAAAHGLKQAIHIINR